jgi:hypothetical protein
MFFAESVACCNVLVKATLLAHNIESENGINQPREIDLDLQFSKIDNTASISRHLSYISMQYLLS